MKKRFMLIFVFMTSIGCTFFSLPIEPDGISSIVFPVQPPTNAEREVMEAELRGELVLIDDCLRVQGEFSDYLIIWPPGYILDGLATPPQIYNEIGRSVVTVGDNAYISGGEIPQEVQESFDSENPTINTGHCDGPYWITGDTVRRER